jgi:Domain of unknown function (DUF4186)
MNKKTKTKKSKGVSRTKKVKQLPSGLKPLKITCTSTDCDNALHCFRKSRKMKAEEKGRCRYCKADLVDWARVHRRRISDVTRTFQEFRKEYIRHHFWHVSVDAAAEYHARKKGHIALRAATKNRVERSVGPKQPVRDGQQTPFEGNMIYYAQHATATCCRKCMSYWHDVPIGIALSSVQIAYFVDLIMAFIDERMPRLADTPERLPRSVRLFEAGGLRWSGSS